MKSLPLRLLFASLAVAGMAGAALVARQTAPAGAGMADAANKFLATLPPELKSKAAFGFDDPHREKWYFTPQQAKRESTRKGVRLDSLDPKQKDAALTLLRTGLSDRGYKQANIIIGLETLLKQLENDKGANTRNSEWYFVSVFGEPSATGTWGWRFEGHHLSVNFTIEKGQVVSGSPTLFGVNPAEVMSGPQKGLRATPEIVDLAKELIASLTDEQNKTARQAKQFPEIQEGRPDANVGSPVGIAAGKLDPKQKATLTKLVEAYAGRLTPDVAAAELARVTDAGFDKVHFAYCIDEQKKGQPNSYRVHGPTFVIEFLNEQADAAGNPANHIHSGWRKLPSDFAVAGK